MSDEPQVNETPTEETREERARRKKREYARAYNARKRAEKKALKAATAAAVPEPTVTSSVTAAPATVTVEPIQTSDEVRQSRLDAIAKRVQARQIAELRGRPTTPDGILVGNTWENTDDLKVQYYLDGSDPDHPLAFERLLPNAPMDWRKRSRKGGRQGYEQPTANARWVNPAEYRDGLFAHKGIRLVKDKETGELVRGTHGDYLAWEPIEAKRAKVETAGRRSKEWVNASFEAAAEGTAVENAVADPNLPKFDGEHGAELIPHSNTRSPAYRWKEE